MSRLTLLLSASVCTLLPPLPRVGWRRSGCRRLLAHTEWGPTRGASGWSTHIEQPGVLLFEVHLNALALLLRVGDDLLPLIAGAVLERLLAGVDKRLAARSPFHPSEQSERLSLTWSAERLSSTSCTPFNLSRGWRAALHTAAARRGYWYRATVAWCVPGLADTDVRGGREHAIASRQERPLVVLCTHSSNTAQCSVNTRYDYVERGLGLAAAAAVVPSP